MNTSFLKILKIFFSCIMYGLPVVALVEHFAPEVVRMCCSGAVRASMAMFACSELEIRPKDKLTAKAVCIRFLQVAVLGVAIIVCAFPDAISRVIYSGSGSLALAVGGVVLVLLPLAIMALDADFWWESLRKYLFFNKVVDPSKYEFLLTFDTKNEMLKYVGTLREMDKKAHLKWWLYMMAMPFLAACVVSCVVCGVVFALLGRVIIALAVLGLGCLYNVVIYYAVVLTEFNSTIKFFGKKKNKQNK